MCGQNKQKRKGLGKRAAPEISGKQGINGSPNIPHVPSLNPRHIQYSPDAAIIRQPHISATRPIAITPKHLPTTINTLHNTAELTLAQLESPEAQDRSPMESTIVCEHAPPDNSSLIQLNEPTTVSRPKANRQLSVPTHDASPTVPHTYWQEKSPEQLLAPMSAMM